VISTPEDVLCMIEKELMVKGGRWVAEFTESERNHKIGDSTFDVCLRGGTRTKGLFLSRILSYFVLPNYQVACYVKKITSSNLVSSSFLKKLLQQIKQRAIEEELKWNWLFLVTEDEPSAPVLKLIEERKDEEVGVLLYSRGSKSFVYSRNLLGKRMKACLKL